LEKSYLNSDLSITEDGGITESDLIKKFFILDGNIITDLKDESGISGALKQTPHFDLTILSSLATSVVGKLKDSGNFFSPVAAKESESVPAFASIRTQETTPISLISDGAGSYAEGHTLVSSSSSSSSPIRLLSSYSAIDSRRSALTTHQPWATDKLELAINHVLNRTFNKGISRCGKKGQTPFTPRDDLYIIEFGATKEQHHLWDDFLASHVSKSNRKNWGTSFNDKNGFAIYERYHSMCKKAKKAKTNITKDRVRAMFVDNTDLFTAASSVKK
jgi:hypothetical protein